MPTRTAVLLAVGLTDRVLGGWTPRLSALRAAGGCVLEPDFPAVTSTSQSSMLTGLPPSVHGAVANGWYDRAADEARLWRQSSRLVHGEKVWETARRLDPSVTCAKLCWWFNMRSSANWSLTPRPVYKADGRKVPDCYTHPAGLRDELQSCFGTFPLFKFWGPGSSIDSTRWIAGAAGHVEFAHAPTISLVYLPHLDYALQRHGPSCAAARCAAAELDAVVGGLLDTYAARGVTPLVVSEYGIEDAASPVHINRALRRAGLLSVRHELGSELLDPGASRAFALADHQCAHVYVADPADIPRAHAACEGLAGVESVWDARAQCGAGIAHARSGELVLTASPGHWFTYYYWLDDALAPDFARTVDIHRKPGYDPAELFLDPGFCFPRLAVARRLLMRKLGMRRLLDVIPLDAGLVRGSHGRTAMSAQDRPLLLGGTGLGVPPVLPMRRVRDVILATVFGLGLDDFAREG